MAKNWGKEGAVWGKRATYIGIIAVIVAILIATYEFWWLPNHTPKPYIALILQTNNQHPLNNTLWIINPTNTIAHTFTFYITSPDSSAILTATKTDSNINIKYNKTDSVYIETHELQGGDIQAINLTLNKYVRPTFQVISTDAPHYCNTTLEIYVPTNVTNLTPYKRYNVWLNSTFGCNSTILATFSRSTFKMCEGWVGNQMTLSFCNSNTKSNQT